MDGVLVVLVRPHQDIIVCISKDRHLDGNTLFC